MIANQPLKHTILYGLIGLILGALFFTVVAASYLVYQDKQYSGKIYPQVYLDRVNLGGLSKQQARDLFAKHKKSFNEVKTTVLYHDEPIATLSATTLSLHTDTDEVIDRAFLVGRSPKMTTLVTERLGALLGFTNYQFQSHIVYNQAEAADFISEAEDHYNLPAKNALFEFKEGKVVSFKPDEKGLRLQSEKFLTDFASAIQSLNKHVGDLQVTLTDEPVNPTVTLSQANEYGIEEEIGEGTSNYSHSIGSRIHNIVLAASKFHGVLIPKGATFSFNDTVGDISALTGYEQAYVIKNGKTVLGDGGGVCQVSTTMFRAALNSGLPIVERHAHAYRVSYYENGSQPGFDATIFGPTVDLKFKNDTPASILIQTEIDKDNNILTFKFYGKRDARVVEISPVTIWDQAPAPPPLYQDDPTLPKGEVKQVDFAASGAKTRFTYKVTLAGQVTDDQTFYSDFRPWQAVYLVGQG